MEKQIFIDCIRLALGAECDKPVLPRVFDWEKLFRLSEFQRVTPIVARALQDHPDWNTKGGQFRDECEKCILLESTIYFETMELYDILDTQGIDFFPFKGVVYKYYYPEPWMRYMKDVDILVRREDIDRVRPVIESAGYSYIDRYSVHDVYISASGLYKLEVHYEMFSDWSAHTEWGTEASKRLVPIRPGSHHLTASDIDSFLIYLIHIDKHSQRGEVFALRAIDYWFIPVQLDDALFAQIKRLGLTRTYNHLNDIRDSWFFGKSRRFRSRGIEELLISMRENDMSQEEYDVELYRWRQHCRRTREKGLMCAFPRREVLDSMFPRLKGHPRLIVIYRPYSVAKFICRFMIHVMRFAWYRIHGAKSPF